MLTDGDARADRIQKTHGFVGKLAGGGFPIALVLALVYPLALLPLGFYLPSERRAIGARLRLAR